MSDHDMIYATLAMNAVKVPLKTITTRNLSSSTKMDFNVKSLERLSTLAKFFDDPGEVYHAWNLELTNIDAPRTRI